MLCMQNKLCSGGCLYLDHSSLCKAAASDLVQITKCYSNVMFSSLVIVIITVVQLR